VKKKETNWQLESASSHQCWEETETSDSQPTKIGLWMFYTSKKCSAKKVEVSNPQIKEPDGIV